MDSSSARAGLLAVLLVGSVALGGIGVGTAAADTVAVEISVVDQDGDPVADADVTITWDGGSTTDTTRSNGRRYFDVPDDKQLTIEVEANNYVRNEPYVVENVSADETVEISMHNVASTTVTVENTEGPLENADVVLRKNGTDQAPVIDGKTGPDGKIESDFIEAGTYDLEVVKRGYLRNKTTLEVRGTTKPTISLESASVTATITVKDNYYDPSRPVPNASVKIGSIVTAQTTSDGGVVANVPVNSQLSLTITKDGYRSTSTSLFVEEQPPSRTILVTRAPALTIDAAANRVVVGENVTLTITDEYGDLVPNATVSVNGESIGVTDSQGEIIVPIRSSGGQSISVESDDVTETITVTGIEEPGTATTTVMETTDEEITTETTTEDSSSAFGPGFGPLVAVIALIAVALLARRRR